MNIFTTIGSFLKRARSGTSADPVHDWLMLLTLSMIVLTGIVIWNAWAFDTVARGGAIGSATTTTQTAFSQPSLDAIRVIFANRAAEESKYKTGVYRFTDPSQ